MLADLGATVSHTTCWLGFGSRRSVTRDHELFSLRQLRRWVLEPDWEEKDEDEDTDDHVHYESAGEEDVDEDALFNRHGDCGLDDTTTEPADLPVMARILVPSSSTPDASESMVVFHSAADLADEPDPDNAVIPDREELGRGKRRKTANEKYNTFSMHRD
jgi:hypothetical protein